MVLAYLWAVGHDLDKSLRILEIIKLRDLRRVFWL